MFTWTKKVKKSSYHEQEFPVMVKNWVKIRACYFTTATTTATTRSTSVDPLWLSFSGQPCHPSLPASSLWGPRCPPQADRQMCEPVLWHSFCHASVPTKPKSLTTSFLLLQQWPLNLEHLSLNVVKLLGYFTISIVHFCLFLFCLFLLWVSFVKI